MQWFMTFVFFDVIVGGGWVCKGDNIIYKTFLWELFHIIILEIHEDYAIHNPCNINEDFV